MNRQPTTLSLTANANCGVVTKRTAGERSTLRKMSYLTVRDPTWLEASLMLSASLLLA